MQGLLHGWRAGGPWGWGPPPPPPGCPVLVSLPCRRHPRRGPGVCGLAGGPPPPTPAVLLCTAPTVACPFGYPSSWPPPVICDLRSPVWPGPPSVMQAPPPFLQPRSWGLHRLKAVEPSKFDPCWSFLVDKFLMMVLPPSALKRSPTFQLMVSLTSQGFLCLFLSVSVSVS